MKNPMNRVYNVSIDFMADDNMDENELRKALNECFDKLGYMIMGTSRDYSWDLKDYNGGL